MARSPLKIARIYLRVSTEEQDLARQAAVRTAHGRPGFMWPASIGEKASRARADRPELQRMIGDLQSGEVIVAEKIDRINRLLLPEAEKLIGSIRGSEAGHPRLGRSF